MGGPELFGVVQRRDQLFFSVPKGGDQNFLRIKEGGPIFTQPKGGPEFFPVDKGGGDQNYFTYAKGRPEKIGDQPSQTDGPPPGKK